MKTKPIYLVGGDKGGVGKSMVSLALLDYLRDTEKVLLIDTDNSNPDVYKTYSSKVKSDAISLDVKDGWFALVDCAEAHNEHTIVINTAARFNVALKLHGSMLNEYASQVGRKLVTLWVINRQIDGLIALSDYLEVMTNSEVHVVQNGKEGAAESFTIYQNSNIRKTIEGAGGKSLFFPDLAYRVADGLYSKRIQFEDAARDMTISNRIELQRFRSAAAMMFKEIVK